MTDRWFSPGTPVSSTNKTDRHDITEIRLKVTLDTITLTCMKSTGGRWFSPIPSTNKSDCHDTTEM